MTDNIALSVIRRTFGMGGSYEPGDLSYEEREAIDAIMRGDILLVDRKDLERIFGFLPNKETLLYSMNSDGYKDVHDLADRILKGET